MEKETLLFAFPMTDTFFLMKIVGFSEKIRSKDRHPDCESALKPLLVETSRLHCLPYHQLLCTKNLVVVKIVMLNPTAYTLQIIALHIQYVKSRKA